MQYRVQVQNISKCYIMLSIRKESLRSRQTPSSALWPLHECDVPSHVGTDLAANVIQSFCGFKSQWTSEWMGVAWNCRICRWSCCRPWRDSCEVASWSQPKDLSGHWSETNCWRGSGNTLQDNLSRISLSHTQIISSRSNQLPAGPFEPDSQTLDATS